MNEKYIHLFISLNLVILKAEVASIALSLVVFILHTRKLGDISSTKRPVHSEGPNQKLMFVLEDRLKKKTNQL